ncbi:uncharacterized protein LOC100201561 [Hydra vulgaris]|uniref:uncharacterized protein LOC100201561 n=1 Tax=Hydra vulgaris TaxID=6087 RepID=UPI00019255D3|nr:uncharacterized protein LOC100201561 [Hydra vulgaris]
MGCAFRFIQYITSLFILACLGLITTSAVLDFWWTNDYFIQQDAKGLWRKCIKRITYDTYNCETYDNLFKFSNYKDTDILLLSLCVCAVFMSTAFILILISICQRYPSKCLILFKAVMTLFGVFACGFALFWGLFKVERPSSNTKLGFVFYLMYGAMGSAVLALIFSIVLLCIQAPGAYRVTKKDDEIIMLAR